jgi:hypothetical protein
MGLNVEGFSVGNGLAAQLVAVILHVQCEVYIVRNLQTVENLNVRIQCLIIVLSTTLAIPN